MNKQNKGKWLLAAGLVGLAGAGLLMRARRVDLSGKVVLITGGSRGLGYLLAQEFARQGCRLAICARDETELERAHYKLSQRGAEVITTRCDVAEQKQVDQWVKQSLQHFGQIDILVNNAGVIQVAPLETVTLQDFEHAFDVMFWGILYSTLAVLPHMQQRGQGRIVNIASIGGKISMPHLLTYGSAKAAAINLSEGLRAELKTQGILVTTVVPGFVRTGSYLNALFKGQYGDEFAWFSLGAGLPFISMSAERAARQIVAATKSGAAEITLTLPANLLARFHGLFPGLTANILGLVNGLVLPKANESGTQIVRGMEAQRELPRSRRRVLNSLITLGNKAGARYHQYPGPNGNAADKKEKKA